MLDLFTGASSSDCRGLSRRTFLRVGGLASLGLGLDTFLRAQAAQPAAQRKSISCILMWMQGGPSHHDSFDPKPDAPAEVRGEFKTIPTTLPGVQVAEHLPLLARNTDKYSIIRGHDPKNGSHGVADHIMMTGHRWNPTLPFPCFGSVVAKQRGYNEGMMPFVQLGRSIDRRFNGGIAGFLGDEFNAFEVPDDPSKAGFTVRDLSVADAQRARLARRYSMLNQVERFDQAGEELSTPVKARDAFYEKAHGLITSPRAKKAYDLASESEKTRERYGMNMFGQSCLLARRLVESGVHFVTVTDGGWDTHANNFKSLKDSRMPPVDKALPQLLADLEQRGLLGQTLVCWLSDFGRTPKVNSASGRDHWATAGFAVMAGAGVPGGQVLGSTDDEGGFVVRDEYGSEDIAATVYTKLGISIESIAKSMDGRPVRLIEGKPIKEWC